MAIETLLCNAFGVSPASPVVLVIVYSKEDMLSEWCYLWPQARSSSKHLHASFEVAVWAIRQFILTAFTWVASWQSASMLNLITLPHFQFEIDSFWFDTSINKKDCMLYKFWPAANVELIRQARRTSDESRLDTLYQLLHEHGLVVIVQGSMRSCLA
jgi:hypothetical protein